MVYYRIVNSDSLITFFTGIPRLEFNNIWSKSFDQTYTGNYSSLYGVVFLSVPETSAFGHEDGHFE